MLNLVYYKDNSGVVRGPIHEDEATALFKANFFRPDHVFRVIDANNAEEFTSIDALRTMNGAETPFGVSGDEKELIRVYKELSTVLRERNEAVQERDSLKAQVQRCEGMRMQLIEQFEQEMKKPQIFDVNRSGDSANFTRIKNIGNVIVRASYGIVWDPLAAQVLRPGEYVDVPGFQGGKYFFIAPYLSDDPLDGSEHVLMFYYPTNEKQEAKFKFPAALPY